MFNKLFKLFISFFVLFTVAFTTNTVTAHADFNTQPNSIWTKSDPEDGSLDEVQKLYNGNEIYYSITTPQNNVYYKVWQKAVANWNSLGVIKLVQVAPNDHNCEITLSGTYHYTTLKHIHYLMHKLHQSLGTLGDTNEEYYPTPVGTNQDRDYLTNTSAKLYPSLWAQNVPMTIIAATHELGHCLGFEHNTHYTHGEPSIMNAVNTGHNAPLGSYERNLLLQNYGEFLNQSN